MIESALCLSFRYNVFRGLHHADDEYRMALYDASADLGDHTLHYTPDGEVRGQGYTAGGKALEGYRLSVDGATVTLDWSSPTWPRATITEAHGFLVYNATLASKDAVVTHAFPQPITSVNGPFHVHLPSPGAATSLIRWSPVSSSL